MRNPYSRLLAVKALLAVEYTDRFGDEQRVALVTIKAPRAHAGLGLRLNEQHDGENYEHSRQNDEHFR